MKIHLLFIGVLLSTVQAFSQISTQAPWVWMNGDNTIDQPGIYGTKGISASANKPGARNISCTWRDVSGQLWLLGGMGFGSSQSGFLNDLWKFEPASNKWTWVNGDSIPDRNSIYGMKGIAAASNHPGGIYSGISWVDAEGNFWLFGGYGYSESGIGLLDALWKYDLSDNSWTWVSGSKDINQSAVYGICGTPDPLNHPGARYCSQSWTDSAGNLWLFGGYGFGQDPLTQGPLNDIWKYSISDHHWTWIKGDSVAGSEAHYGSKGIADPLNNPGSRYISSSWKDADGKIWVFGGQGYDEYQQGILNDLWQYDPGTNQWTWISGQQEVNQAGNYGAQGVEHPANQPGGRYISSAWVDLSGDFWLFGGYGYDTAQTGYLNDFWRYKKSTGHWTWIKGDPVIDQPGVYGIQCLPDSLNKSGSRMSTVSWTDGVGNLWLFGGYGYDSSGTGVLNDLWKVNGYQSVLPLTLLDFNGSLMGRSVQLQWKTSAEAGFSHFDIQRSFDGTHFQSAGIVMPKGNSGINQYQWIDQGLSVLPWQKVFYRLRLVDQNGKTAYSRTLLFRQQEDHSGLSVFPNPVQAALQLSFTQSASGPVQISIYDSQGRMVSNRSEILAAGKVSLTLETNFLAPGTYWLRVSSHDLISCRSFIRQ